VVRHRLHPDLEKEANMVISQDHGLQQPPEHALVHGPDAQADSTNRTPTETPVAMVPQEAAAGEAQSADVGLGQELEQQITQVIQPIFSQALEQQITQAIQPMLDEFRQRMAQALSDQMAAKPRHGAGQSDTGQEAPQGPDVQGPVPSAAPEAAPQQCEDEQAGESQPQPALIRIRNVQHARERPLVGALTSAVQTVGRSSAQWLQPLLVAGLGALLAESTHVIVRQRAEQGLHTLLQKAFEAAPPDFANQKMREKVERTLQLILREALDAVFAEGVRTSVQQGGQQTIQQALRGDFGGALRAVEALPQVMMAALIAVLRRHQQTILRLLLALALLEVGSSLEQSEQAK
jgi:hypothetical protein